jgi:GDP/UDP-N,N'-diacetylbacillosamine 2-epimerase (hydrolysing)
MISVKMRIGILTSSRADFGIYMPLLERLKNDAFFKLEIIAFGTHLSDFHGKTIKQIEVAGFDVKYRIESMLLTDSASSISTAMGLTNIKFADFWKEHGNDFDLVFCLGDRYEMFAAVVAGIPFQIPFAHLHGGETTLGAIDNIFRHTITMASKYHFVSTETYASRVKELIELNENIYNVGALSLDNLGEINLLSIEEFKDKWNVDLSIKTILTTFHPETIALDKNEFYAKELVEAIEALADYQVLITMPNADTAGNIIREILIDNFAHNSRVFLIENLGSQSYFTALKYCAFLLGNTSSGIIEAASFGKAVINLGDRQKGRIAGKNVLHTGIHKEEILNAVKIISEQEFDSIENLYWNGGAADKIIDILKRDSDSA